MSQSSQYISEFYGTEDKLIHARQKDKERYKTPFDFFYIHFFLFTLGET